jgi:hypothetical protein
VTVPGRREAEAFIYRKQKEKGKETERRKEEKRREKKNITSEEGRQQ